MLIQPDSLKSVAIAILQKGGSDAREAEWVAAHLVRANLTGHDSHGVGMLPAYVRILEAGLLRPNQEPELVKDEGSILMFDGQRGYGQVVGRLSMEQAIARCRETGLALMTLRNSHHLGRIGTYAEQALARSLVSIHFVNVVDHHPLVAPHRGSDARYSTNPICLAMPGSAKQEPVMLDMATSRVAHGKVRVAHNKGERLPGKLLIDSSGQPTDDAGVMFREPVGALRSLGEHKGYGLALFGELLGGILSGGGTIQPGNKRHLSIINNMFVLVIDPERFVERPWLESELQALVEHCKASPPANPDEPVLVPGEPERLTAKQREKDGIPVDDVTWEQILSAGERLGLDREELTSIAS